MYGPNTNTSGGSIVFYLELQAHFEGTAWTQCDSWYRDEGGRIVTNWPGYMREYAERTGSFDPAEFVFARGD